MTRNELINRVKVYIDEITPVNGLVVQLSNYDDKPLDSFIDSILDECGDDVQKAAPIYNITAKSFSGNIMKINAYSGYVELPDDFLRLIEFRMSCWERGVHIPLVAGSITAQRQHNEFLRGGTAKPECVLGHRDGKQVIEYYSVSGDNHVLDAFMYVASTAAENVNAILHNAICWKAASKVLGIVGNLNGVKLAEERLTEVINLKN